MSFKVIPAFACGAILATAVFLVIPESLILLGGGHEDHSEHEDEEEHHDEDEDHNSTRFRFLEEEMHEDDGHGNESEASWKFGAALLGGFIFPILMSAFFPSHHDHLSPIVNDEVQDEVMEKSDLV